MAINKRNNKWGYDFWYEEKRHRSHKWKTKREAQQAELDLKSNLQKGINLNNNIVFADYYEKWMKVNKSHLAPQTYKNHITMHKWIEDYFKNKKMKDITRMDYQTFITWFGMEAKNRHNKKTVGHGKDAVKKLNGFVRSCVSDALFEGIIHKDFTHNIVLTHRVQSKDKELKYLELDEFKVLKRAVIDFPDLSSLFIFIMMITGGRYSDVKHIEYNHINEIDSSIFLPGTKNDTAPRTVKVPRADMRLITSYINSKPRNINGYVFHSRVSHLTVQAVNKRLKQYCEDLGVKHITSHALRHTHCSILIYEGVDIYYISERLGHKNISTTQETYAHLLKAGHEKAEEKAIEVINGL